LDKNYQRVKAALPMSFNIVINPLPVVFYQCGRMFQLHSSGHYQWHYYTGSNGTGTLLHAGDLIESGTYYIFSGPDSKPVPNNLASQSP
jgi:hypothetical protein